MASCYICGASNASYRQEVSTGRSQGTHYGKSVSTSARKYYGVRTVCKNCAASIDRFKRVKGIIGLIIGCAILFYFWNPLGKEVVTKSSLPQTENQNLEKRSTPAKIKAKREVKNKFSKDTNRKQKDNSTLLNQKDETKFRDSATKE